MKYIIWHGAGSIKHGEIYLLPEDALIYSRT